MSITKLHVMRGPDLRGGITTVVGVMPAETLVLHHDIPQRDTLRGAGYQRNPAEPRVASLARELREKNVDLPTSVLLSLRKVDASKALTKTDVPDRYVLHLDSEKAQDDHRLYVVDGQHRVLALRKALDDGGVLQDKKIPFVCMIGATELQEMEQFHVVNSTAKSVPTDLALDLLRDRAAQDPEFVLQLERRGLQWQVDAQALTHLLATTSQVWKNRIRLPNMPKGETTVPSASFVRSLKTLLTQTALFQNAKDAEKQAQIIDAYWHAIRRVLPEAFEKPLEFNIQKGVGVDAMHAIFPLVIDLARSERMSLFDPNAYVAPLKQALESIEGRDGNANIVSGVDFWRVGSDGASGGFAGASGKRRLAQYLQSLLPQLAL